jgi:ElaB/YqjD/DUF883 family membrane-anchored ribosome-binding protein
MPTDSFNQATDELSKGADALQHGANAASVHGQAALNDALAGAEPYAKTANEQLDEAQRYVLDRVKERPLTATLAGLGVGVLLGLLLSTRSK